MGKKEGVGIITINREDVRNALKAEIREDIAAALQLAEDDPEVRVVIITGAGKKYSARGAILRQWRRTPCGIY